MNKDQILKSLRSEHCLTYDEADKYYDKYYKYDCDCINDYEWWDRDYYDKYKKGYIPPDPLADESDPPKKIKPPKSLRKKEQWEKDLEAKEKELEKQEKKFAEIEETLKKKMNAVKKAYKKLEKETQEKQEELDRKELALIEREKALELDEVTTDTDLKKIDTLDLLG